MTHVQACACYDGRRGPLEEYCFLMQALASTFHHSSTSFFKTHAMHIGMTLSLASRSL